MASHATRETPRAVRDYQHCKEKHLHRYFAEFDHRHNHRSALGYSDIDRTLSAIRGVEGKRLMYRQPD
jgi:hypothetical protein